MTKAFLLNLNKKALFFILSFCNHIRKETA